MAPVSRLQLGKFCETEKLGSIIKIIYQLGRRRRILESRLGRQGGREIPFRFYEGGGEGGRERLLRMCSLLWPANMWLGRTVDQPDIVQLWINTICVHILNAEYLAQNTLIINPSLPAKTSTGIF